MRWPRQPGSRPLLQVEGAPTNGQGKKGASERPKIFLGEETKPEVLVCKGRDAAGGLKEAVKE